MEATILESSRESQRCNEFLGNTVNKILTSLVMDGNWTYCSNYFVMYKVWNYYVVYLKLILYVKYNLINKN